MVFPGFPRSVLRHQQTAMHIDKITTQLYLKEVGSVNAGTPACHSRCAQIPPYPMGVEPANPLLAQCRTFYRSGAHAV